MKKINQDNGLNNPLTYEELKKCKGFENITESEALKELEVINRIAKMMYYMYMNNQQIED